jgi:hypothetical protein
MAVAGPSLQALKDSGGLISTERVADHVPIGTQSPKKFQNEANPLIDAYYELTRQYGIFAQDTKTYRETTEPLDKALEGSGVTTKNSFEPRHVQFQNQSSTEHGQ